MKTSRLPVQNVLHLSRPRDIDIHEYGAEGFGLKVDYSVFRGYINGLKRLAGIQSMFFPVTSCSKVREQLKKTEIGSYQALVLEGLYHDNSEGGFSEDVCEGSLTLISFARNLDIPSLVITQNPNWVTEAEDVGARKVIVTNPGEQRPHSQTFVRALEEVLLENGENLFL